jgi:actin-like ATPase involved in cell morphogenesis
MSITQTKTKEDKTTYMREYKRKAYKENPEQIKEKNKAYYYKYKFKVSVEEAHKYDTLLPNVVRLRKEIEEILNKKPELINDLLNPYITTNPIIPI